MKTRLLFHILTVICLFASVTAKAQNMYQIYDREGNLLKEIPFSEVSDIEFTRISAADTVQWKLFATGHITEVCWQEDYDTKLWYIETEFDGILYCKLTDAWYDWETGLPSADYFFYWDTNTNYLYVPLQGIGMDVDYEDIYTSDAADFYNAYYGWGYTVPSQEYFDWAPTWMANNSFFQPYYDGNGGFYLADWLYLGKDGSPNGRGYQFGGKPDYFIADGFLRYTDYNDENHIDLSVAYMDGIVTSTMMQGYDSIPKTFETELRHDEIADNDGNMVYYLKDYFSPGHCLAFSTNAPECLEDNSLIYGVDRQPTGIYTSDSCEVYVKVMKGYVHFNSNDSVQYPSFDYTLYAFTYNEDGAEVEVGIFKEFYTATQKHHDDYTLSDLSGGYLEDYLGTWTMTSTDFSNDEQSSYDVTFEQTDENIIKISNITGLSQYFDDAIYVEYNTSYGLLELSAQQIAGTYNDDSVYCYLMDPDARSIYSSAQMYGGLTNDGNFAFVNVYDGYNICGLYFRTMSTSQGIAAIYNIYGSKSASAVALRKVSNPLRITSAIKKVSQVKNPETSVQGLEIMPRPVKQRIEKKDKSQLLPDRDVMVP